MAEVKKKRSVGRALLMITQIGISMIVPIFLGAFIGSWLDRRLGTVFFFLVFLAVGIFAAFRNIYYLTKPFYAEDLEREKKEQEYWDSLKNTRQGGAADKGAGPDLALSRREREKRAAGKEQQEAGHRDAAKSGLAAEEEFAAWRRKNGR